MGVWPVVVWCVVIQASQTLTTAANAANWNEIVRDVLKL